MRRTDTVRSTMKEHQKIKKEQTMRWKKKVLVLEVIVYVVSGGLGKNFRLGRNRFSIPQIVRADLVESDQTRYGPALRAD